MPISVYNNFKPIQAQLGTKNAFVLLGMHTDVLLCGGYWWKEARKKTSKLMKCLAEALAYEEHTQHKDKVITKVPCQTLILPKQ